MKVLLSSHGAGPYGAERMILSLARGLASRGHDVVLELPHAGPSLDVARELEGVEVRVSHRPRLPRNLQEGIRYLLGVPSSAWAARRMALEVDPDLCWVNSLFNPWAAIGAKSAGYPVVWHLHERNPDLPLGILAPLLAGLTSLMLAPISSYVAHSLSAYPWIQDRVRILENPLLDPLEPTEGEPEEPFTVGFVGQMEPRKRAPDLAHALARLPGAHGVFVGDGKARSELERAIQALGVADRVELLGFREDAPSEFHRFHCLAIPSLREPFGLVALEAMARGIPVVAAASGALPEVLGDAALFHEPGEPASLAGQLERLRASASLRRELREKGLKRIAEFRYETWLDAVEEILEETAHGRGSR